MTNWYDQINLKTDYLLNHIKSHAFIKDLMDGTLEEDIFYFYIKQDVIYLSEYKKILAQIAIKCDEDTETQFFLDAATGIIAVENALHQNYIKEKNTSAQASPTCELYISYLSRMINTKPVEEGLAAVLPCFTIYKQIGDYILNNQTNQKSNPYQNWINTYGGEEFENSVTKAIEITNKYATQTSPKLRSRMNLAFEKASKLEWMFWDSAYKQERWKV